MITMKMIDSNRMPTMDTYTPLFERMGKDDIQELEYCRGQIKNLEDRVNYLEKMNLDLEKRLEREAKQNIELEKKCGQIQETWEERCSNLEKKLENVKSEHEKDIQKNEKLREHLSRTERELYGIYQKKYEFMKGKPASDRKLSESELADPSTQSV